MNEGNGQLFWREEGIHIPSAYQKIEGCKTGTYNSGPWFSTGVRIVGQNLKLEGYALLRDSSGEWNCILGAETSDNSSDTIKVRRQENDRICCNHNDNAYIEAGFNTWFYFYVDATTLKVNNETRTLTWASQVKSPDIIIGGQRIAGSILSDRLWVGSIGLIKFFENDVLVGQFVPAKRKADSICGFYDTVTERFFTSESSIQFQEHMS